MYVAFNNETGWSDDSMRFATRADMLAWFAEQDDPDAFSYRVED